jgi:predicted transcriptional regulator
MITLSKGYIDPYRMFRDMLSDHPEIVVHTPGVEKNTEVTAALNRVRTAENVSVEDMAARMGVSRRRLIEIEDGDSTTIHAAATYADALGYELSFKITKKKGRPGKSRASRVKSVVAAGRPGGAHALAAVARG